MKTVTVILMGTGRVGKAFIRLLEQKQELCREKYSLDLRFQAAFNSRGGFFFPSGSLVSETFTAFSRLADPVKNPFWKSGLRLSDVLSTDTPGVLVECTPSDLETGGPSLSHIRRALERGWHVVTASKGALVKDFRGLVRKARENRVSLGMSGATAAALPALDVAVHSLAGSRIRRMEGILNGTSNYILTRMGQGASYHEALEEARSKGIAETDPSHDVEGWDTAAKLLIIANAALGKSFRLEDVSVEGITRIPESLRRRASSEAKAIKLLGVFDEEASPELRVGPVLLEPSHPLWAVRGTRKGITFWTDTMGEVTVVGGKSDPMGAAAALFKDILRIFSPES